MVPLMTQNSFGWGMVAHMMLSKAAAQAFPQDLPEFMRTPGAINEIEYLAPEPDRWRERSEPELSDMNAPDHFIDLERLELLGGPLPGKRYEFYKMAYDAQKAHPEQAKELSPDKIGTQPYQTIEVWERLKVAFRNYRQLSAAHKDTKPVEAAAIYYAGWLGHYVEDGSNPHHATEKHDGWVGPNPNGYSTAKGIHNKFERDFVVANVKPADFVPLIPKEAKLVADPFHDYVEYLKVSGSQVEKLYQIDKNHGFDGAGTAEGKQFVAECMARGATEFRDLVYTAWVRSADPVPPYKP